MSGKTFRGIHSVKHRSSSTTFISLHFNKADEDQLEISYTDEKNKSDASGTSQRSLKWDSNQEESSSKFFIEDDLEVKEESTSIKDSDLIKSNKRLSFLNSNEEHKGKLSKSFEKTDDEFTKSLTKSDLKPPQYAELDKSYVKDEIDSNVASPDSVSKCESHLKLSPAVEASELGDENIFNHYISDELERAKCDILDSKKEISSSFLSSHSKESSENDCNLSSSEVSETAFAQTRGNTTRPPDIPEGATFLSTIKKTIDYANIARNSVKSYILIAIFACFCAPIPSWLSGFLVGAIISSYIVRWLYKPKKNVKSFPLYNVIANQNIEVAEVKNDSGIFKGWMNELPSCLNYHPDRYHVSSTRSLYVRLDGSYLRFSFPAKNIPKRAMFNEPRHDLQFIHQQHYDITGATVELLPQGLANKRLWSKKYPICLRILNSKEAVLSNSSKQDTLDGSFISKTAMKKENFTKKFTQRINENNEVVIYLFSRTDREKNLWYYRFIKASKIKVLRPHTPSSCIMDNESTLENKRAMSLDFASLHLASLLNDGVDDVDSFVEISLSKQQKFEIYMSSLLAPVLSEQPFSLASLKKDGSDKKVKPSLHSNILWLNLLLGRLFFDFLVEDVWAQLVTEKIQKKLNKLKLPFFLTELTVKDINLGSALPKIHHASDPYVDERGLWIDIDLSYNGSFHMTLETKLNLLRLKGEELWSSLSTDSKKIDVTDTPIKSSVYNSDEEDSAESSTDEDVPLPEVSTVDSTEESSLPPASGSTSRKIMKFVDRLAQSPYFQHATKNRYIKKKMEDLSNTPLVLTVEVQYLTGTLALNIPPWPTDRLWYGFRTNPFLSITARPKLGQHVVTITHVTEWIEKKLVSEFQKVLVMPNMDDLTIPIMQPSSFSEEE